MGECDLEKLHGNRKIARGEAECYFELLKVQFQNGTLIHVMIT